MAGREVYDIVKVFTEAQKGDNTEDRYKTLTKSPTWYLVVQLTVQLY